jgi:hypothetical protein
MSLTALANGPLICLRSLRQRPYSAGQLLTNTVTGQKDRAKKHLSGYATYQMG